MALEIQNSGSARTFTYGSSPENLIGKLTESLPLTGGPSKTWNYSYDDAGRLQMATSSTGNLQQYDYDPAGNLTHTSLIGPPLPAPEITNYSNNNLNQIASANATPYSYDANGNLTDDGVRTYTWNAADQLTKINFKTDPLKTIQLYYNGLGHWTRFVTTNAAGVIEQRFLWCGETLCQERTAADAVRNRFYPEGQRFNSQNFYYARDHLGSVRDVLAIPGGNPAVPPYDYSAYGKPAIQGPPIVPMSYAGLYYHSDAGLYLATYRAYNPANGRWLNRDPIEEQGGINLYAYVNGNPVNAVDSIGLSPEDVHNSYAWIHYNYPQLTIGSNGRIAINPLIDGTKVAGFAIGDTATIQAHYYNDELSELEKRELMDTLLHELLHVYINNKYGSLDYLWYDTITRGKCHDWVTDKAIHMEHYWEGVVPKNSPLPTFGDYPCECSK